MTTWDPAESKLSPNNLDALVYGLIEVLGLATNSYSSSDALNVAGEMQKQLTRERRPNVGSYMPMTWGRNVRLI